jgi:hypothetical protein
VRELASSQPACRCSELDGRDDLVEAAIAARGLAGGAGGREAPDGGLLEGLREVAEGGAEGAERGLGLGPRQAGTQARGQRMGVELGRPQAREL